MSILELALALALLASLGGCVWLWRRQSRSASTPALMPQLIAQPTPMLPSPVLTSIPLEVLTQPLFRSAAATLDVGLVVVDPARQVVFVNALATELLDAPPDATGSGLIALLRDHQADSLVAEVLADGEPREISIKPIGSGRTLRLRCTVLDPDGEVAGALLVIRDITQISMLERSRRDLVANVSHELRTPLASLKLLVETVQSEPPPEVTRRMLGQMAQEIDAVTQLVDELHELSQIESGRITLQLAPVSLGPVVERSMERIRPQADRKQITITAELDDRATPALIDEDRIGQVLLNLLHNAVKFTSTGGTVRLRTVLLGPDAQESAAQPARWIQISVSDTGIGIPAQELPRIFERFYKVDRARTRNAGGTGLGLAIAKHLVEGHGGRLWADSAEGRGSTFTFTLPAA